MSSFFFLTIFTQLTRAQIALLHDREGLRLPALVLRGELLLEQRVALVHVLLLGLAAEAPAAGPAAAAAAAALVGGVEVAGLDHDYQHGQTGKERNKM